MIWLQEIPDVWFLRVFCAPQALPNPRRRHELWGSGLTAAWGRGMFTLPLARVKDKGLGLKHSKLVVWCCTTCIHFLSFEILDMPVYHVLLNLVVFVIIYSLNFWPRLQISFYVSGCQAIKNNPAAKARVLKSYEMMLDFYGIKLKSPETGEVERADNWQPRFKHLNKWGYKITNINIRKEWLLALLTLPSAKLEK